MNSGVSKKSTAGVGPGTIVVTVDGPAASGKSTVSRAVAQHFGWKWVSTGVFYRGLATVALGEGADLEDEKQLAALASRQDLWRVEMGDDQTRIFYKGSDVSDRAQQEDMGSKASQISRFPAVRKALLEAQRDCARGQRGLVAEGRDCGTVVFPQATAKVYLTASPENRAERRALEQGLSAEATAAIQNLRDRQDSTRGTAPLAIPQGALELDSTSLSLAEVVSRVIEHVNSRCFPG